MMNLNVDTNTMYFHSKWKEAGVVELTKGENLCVAVFAKWNG